MLDLERAAPILGHSFIERMTGKKYAILKIGNEFLTKHQLVTQIGTGNFRAARILSNLIARLELHSVKDLYHISPYQLAGEHGIGTTTLFVLMALFEAKGLDIDRWYGKARGKDADKVSFDTLKDSATKRDREAAKQEKTASKRRKRARTSRAHREAVNEFLQQAPQV